MWISALLVQAAFRLAQILNDRDALLKCGARARFVTRARASHGLWGHSCCDNMETVSAFHLWGEILPLAQTLYYGHARVFTHKIESTGLLLLHEMPHGQAGFMCAPIPGGRWCSAAACHPRCARAQVVARAQGVLLAPWRFVGAVWDQRRRGGCPCRAR